MMRYRLRTLMIVLVLGPALFYGACTRTAPQLPLAAKPLRVSEQREAEILRTSVEVKLGMVTEDVDRLMGNPDEVRPLYETMVIDPEQIGTTYWYCLAGSRKKLEKAVRVSFDLNGRVTAIDRLD